MKKLFIIPLLSFFIISMFNELNAATIKWAGARQSWYGITGHGQYPFPSHIDWENIIWNMALTYEGKVEPMAVWIVGCIKQNKYCLLEFGWDGTDYDTNTIKFYRKDDPGFDTTRHEKCLTHFDTTGIKVYLQVEPGDGDILKLIEIILTKFGHHPCVKGFAVDGEWYLSSQNQDGKKITDAEALAWEEKVKSFNSNYKLVLKHWEFDKMPDTYRGDIIFLNDSQGYDTFDELIIDMVAYWAYKFKLNPVWFQVGYWGDENWWKPMSNPPKEIGETLAGKINTNQEIGIFWVDFTLRYDELDFLWEDHIPTIIDNNSSKKNAVKPNNTLNIVQSNNTPFIIIHYLLPDISDNALLNIIDTKGVTLFTLPLNTKAGNIQLHTENNAAGIYYINVLDDNTNITKKIAIIK